MPVRSFTRSIRDYENAATIDNWYDKTIADYNAIREEVMKDPDVIARVQQYEAEKNSKILPSSKRKVEKELENYIDWEVLKRRRAYSKQKYSTKERLYKAANDAVVVAFTITAMFS